MAQSGVLWVPRIQLIRGFVHTMTMTDLSVGGRETVAGVKALPCGIRLRLHDRAGMPRFSTARKRPPVPGRHIADQQAKLYILVCERGQAQNHSREIAVAKAGFNVSTGVRLVADPRMPSRSRSPRSRRRPDPLAASWESEIVPMLRASPGLRPITVPLELRGCSK
jgi:hypothetical protein